VTDLCWSKNEQFLASGGLDKNIYIYSVQDNFSVIKKITEHTGFVKGLSFDPVGTYLASQSDDKSLLIFNSLNDWELDQKIQEPFKSSNNSCFFKRLR
jgi:protein HIRA/HIR1